jgi:protein polybromo-1
VLTDGSGDEGFIYFEQYCVKNVSYKTGDCVYVNTDKHHPCVARIDKIWTDAEGDLWFSGPWFVHPFETEHLPTRMFFVHELLMSSVQDISPMHSIVGKCAVLVLKDYVRCRPVGLAERDVYVTESRYNEVDKQIRKLKAIKKFSHSSQIDADEFYYFDEEIHPLRIPSPFLFHDLHALFGHPAHSQQPVIPGFVRFANEMLPVLKQTHSSLSFPELLQRIAQQWDSLQDALKRGYNEKSQYLIKSVELDEVVDETEDEIFACQCQWSGCKKTFSGPAELAAHCLSTAADSHIIIAKTTLNEFPCLWLGCSRAKRPFGQLARIVRHVKEVHLKSVTPADVSVASEPSSSSSGYQLGSQPTSENASTTQHILSSCGLVKRFVTPPAQQTVQHSNVYLKYVERLRSGASNPKNVCEGIGDSCISDRQMKDLKSQFLTAGLGSHKSVIDALWALRDTMMLDALKLTNDVEQQYY